MIDLRLDDQDPRATIVIARLVDAFGLGGPVAWWIVDHDWSEIQARGGRTDTIFELGPLDRAEAIYRRIPASDRLTLAELPTTGQVFPRCRVTHSDGSLSFLAVGAIPIDTASIAYVALDVTEQTRADLERELAERSHIEHLEQLASETTAIRSKLDASELAVERMQSELDRLSSDLAVERRAHQIAEERASHQEEALARAVHDLRAPLNTVLGFTELLAREEPDEERRRWLSHVRDAASHVTETSELMLQLVAAGNERTKAATERVPLAPLVENATSIVRHAAADRRLTIEVEVPSGLDALADRRLLTHIITNLLSNALHHTPPGGTITVTGADAGEFVTLLVSDTGPGIPPEHLDAVFEPFQRGHGHHSDRSGAGLGLAICREYVEAMRGSIGAFNAADGGATFWVDLPSTVRRSPASPLILVGTSDRATAELVGVALRDDAAVRTLRTGHAVIHAARVEAPDAVLLGADLGHRDQLADLVAAIRSRETPPAIAVFTTGTPPVDLPGVTASIALPATPEEIRSIAADMTRSRHRG